MFTGIVEALGTVAEVRRTPGGAILVVDAPAIMEEVEVGDSIAVNGCCVTVTDCREGQGFRADLMGETIDRTALGGLAAGDRVDLERATRADSRLGGHLVQGHVDAVAEVVAVDPRQDWTVMTFGLPDSLAPYIVEKGSIAVDGASLTVMAVGDGMFSVGLIPHTLAATVLGARQPGDRVNLEADVIAKYVERMLAAGVATPYGQIARPPSESEK